MENICHHHLGKYVPVSPNEKGGSSQPFLFQEGTREVDEWLNQDTSQQYGADRRPPDRRFLTGLSKASQPFKAYF